jgi:branched-chain amino acid transport system ATP-binding protein
MIDELSLGLAPALVADLLEMVREIHAAGTTIVLVEQSVNIALTLAERAVFMEKGEIRFEGATAELVGRRDILRSVFLEGASATLGPVNGRVKSRRPGRSAHKEARVVISATDLHARFGGVIAVNGVDLEVREGEIVGIIGPNGAGKTTVLDLLSGYVTPHQGSIKFHGTDITGCSPDKRSRIGLGRSFQDARLFPSMTVREVIRTAHDRHLRFRDPASGMLALPDQRVEEELLAARSDELIEMLGLGAYADKFVSELSTGTRRIVDIACSLAHRPSVLLLDEPSSGIAQRESESLGPLLQTVKALTGVSLVVVEHDMPLITSISDRLVALDLGRVIAEGRPREVVNHPDVVASYLGSDRSAINRSGLAMRQPARRAR